MRKDVLPPVDVVRCPPENYSEADSAHFSRNFQDRVEGVHVRAVEGATVVQRYVFDRATLLEAYSQTRPLPRSERLKAYAKRAVFGRRRAPELGWAIDTWSGGYFHWITEALPRLLTLRDEVGCDRVMVPERFASRDYIVESLERLSVAPWYYSDRRSYRVDRLWLASRPKPCQFHDGLLHRLRGALVEERGPSAPATGRLYISRAKARRRRVVNEDEVVRLLESMGFETVHMEDLSFREQQERMATTQVVVSNHGAGLTNQVFMPRGGAVVEMKSDSENINNCFFNLARSLGHRYYYTINPGTVPDVQRANVVVDLGSLETVLAKAVEAAAGPRPPLVGTERGPIA